MCVDLLSTKGEVNKKAVVWAAAGRTQSLLVVACLVEGDRSASQTEEK